MDKNYFSTIDLGLASFLDMSGIDLREVYKKNPEDYSYRFEFRIEDDSEKLLALVNEWNSSERARDLKRFSYSNKKLRAALRERISNDTK